MKFFDGVEKRINETGSMLCVGLDPRQEDMTDDELDMLRYDPTLGLFYHGSRLFEATSKIACCWKVNAAFYEAWGSAGWLALERLIPILSGVAPVLLDGKRGDIGSTAMSYAKSAVKLGVQAVTASPYLGRDSIKPFIDHGLDVFMLVRTSNSSAADVQDVPASFPTWKRVMDDAMSWSASSNLGFVVGANEISTLRKVREQAPDRWILSPGVGAQGARIDDVVKAGVAKLIIPVSRGISNSEDPAAAAEKFAVEIARSHASVQVSLQRSQTLKESVANSLFDSGCVKFGQFKLKSGIASPVYLDLRRLVSHPDLLAQVAELYAQKLINKNFDVLAALPYAALPIGTAISLSMNRPMIYPRREQKNYGTCALIEGDYAKNSRAIVVDDLITKGDSKLEVINLLEKEGIVVNDVCVLIDREGGGREVIESQGKNLISVFKFCELLDIWLGSGRITPGQHSAVTEFLVGQ